MASVRSEIRIFVQDQGMRKIYPPQYDLPDLRGPDNGISTMLRQAGIWLIFRGLYFEHDTELEQKDHF
jgi:hypothetical protein